MRKNPNKVGIRAGGKIAGTIAANKTARTGGVRPTVPPGGIRPTPVNAGTTLGKRLSKLARR